MDKRKTRIIAVVSLFLILGMSLTASAQQGKQVRAGMRDDIARTVGVMGFIRGLQLTETQRDEIKAVLQAHKAELLENRKELLRARLALVKEDPNGPGYFGSAKSRLMAIRLHILSQIRAILTVDQLAVLQERQQRQEDRIQRRLEQLQK